MNLKIQIVSHKVAALLDQSRQLAELGFRREGAVEVFWRLDEPKAHPPRILYFQTLKK